MDVTVHLSRSLSGSGILKLMVVTTSLPPFALAHAGLNCIIAADAGAVFRER